MNLVTECEQYQPVAVERIATSLVNRVIELVQQLHTEKNDGKKADFGKVWGLTVARNGKLANEVVYLLDQKWLLDPDTKELVFNFDVQPVADLLLKTGLVVEVKQYQF